MKKKCNIVKSFSEFFLKNVIKESISFNGRTLAFKVNDDIEENDTTEILNSLFNNVTTLPNKKIEIILHSCLLDNVYIYYGLNDFYNNYEKFEKDFEQSLILILLEDGSSVLKDTEEMFIKEKAIIFNYFIYRKILEYLKVDVFFTTLLNESNNQFIIISKDNGVFHIGYKYSEVRLKDLDDLKPAFQDLKALFQKKEFVQFFKETITNTGIHEKDIQDRFFEIIKNLKLLLNLAEKDYESYVLDFAFDKIKSKFKEERNKYFESLEKNIDTVSKQVFSFPLTFSATAFASYQVKDKPWILGLIILAYLLYTIIAFYILSIVKYNILCLKGDVKKEEDEIKKTYNKIYSDFENDFKKIWKKISKLETLIIILKSILSILLVSFVVYSFVQIVTPKKNDEVQIINIPSSNIKLYIHKTQPIIKQDSADKIKENNKKILEIKKDSVIKTP